MERINSTQLSFLNARVVHGSSMYKTKNVTNNSFNGFMRWNVHGDDSDDEIIVRAWFTLFFISLLEIGKLIWKRSGFTCLICSHARVRYRTCVDFAWTNKKKLYHLIRHFYLHITIIIWYDIKRQIMKIFSIANLIFNSQIYLRCYLFVVLNLFSIVSHLLVNEFK